MPVDSLVMFLAGKKVADTKRAIYRAKNSTDIIGQDFQLIDL